MSKFFNLTGTQAYINQFKGRIGNVSQLKTTSKNLTGAINELKLAIANLQPQQGDVVWRSLNNTDNTQYVVKTNSDTLLSCQAHGSNGNKYLQYSEDNGVTWQDTNVTYCNLSEDGYSKIIQTDDTLILYGNNSKYVEIGNDTFNTKAMLYSEDGGKTWQISKFTDNQETSTYTPRFITNTGAILASGTTIHDSAVARSTDGGKTWQPVNCSGNDNEYIQINYRNRILALNKITNISQEIQYSDDDGATWHINSSNTTCKYKSHIIANNNIIVGTTSDLIYSTDNGETWNTYSSGVAVETDFIKTQNGTLVVATTSNGILYSTDNGVTWNNSNVTNIKYSRLIQTINNILLAYYSSSTTAKIKYSEDNGVTWQDSNVKSDNIGSSLYLTDTGTLIAYSHVSSEYILQYSEDGGKTWQNSDYSSTNTIIYNIFIGENVAVISTRYDGIIYSKDGGRTWQHSNYTGENYKCNSFKLIDPNTLLALTTEGNAIYCQLN